jgi:hypothetical protein
MKNPAGQRELPRARATQELVDAAGSVPGCSGVLELCPRGNNKDVIIIILVHDNVYIPC